eukprot:NODE_2788_length_866_cov_92.850673_g2301_i0.p1 GENE.NODE_2788_length_866_cov_92.850673_g2301_i0~~NODE_2788_length_866_cov_92.850673_g2301_i0.p1  ORF type:complete len:275 (-),score=54.83 NODE_2788_length_866_cov_92.850673_g2301_i0:42-785(-)
MKDERQYVESEAKKELRFLKSKQAQHAFLNDVDSLVELQLERERCSRRTKRQWARHRDFMVVRRDTQKENWDKLERMASQRSDSMANVLESLGRNVATADYPIFAVSGTQLRQANAAPPPRLPPLFSGRPAYSAEPHQETLDELDYHEAALVIQCAWRVYSAIKAVNLRRHAVWLTEVCNKNTYELEKFSTNLLLASPPDRATWPWQLTPFHTRLRTPSPLGPSVHPLGASPMSEKVAQGLSMLRTV